MTTPDEGWASPMAMMQNFLHAADEALAEEGIDEPRHGRIMNRLTWGDPEGPLARRAAGRHTAPAGGQGWTSGSMGGDMSDDEAAAMLWKAEQETQQQPGMLHDPVWEPGAAVFGHDGREISFAIMDDPALHPLISSCKCGRQVTRQSPDTGWVHDE